MDPQNELMKECLRQQKIGGRESILKDQVPPWNVPLADKGSDRHQEILPLATKEGQKDSTEDLIMEAQELSLSTRFVEARV